MSRLLPCFFIQTKKQVCLNTTTAKFNKFKYCGKMDVLHLEGQLDIDWTRLDKYTTLQIVYIESLHF